MKKISLIVIILLLIMSIVAFGEEFEEADFETYTERGKVLETTELLPDPDLYIDALSQDVKLKVESGKFKGEIFEIKNILENNQVYDIPVETGEKVVLLIYEYTNGDLEIHIADYYRTNYLVYLAAALIILLLFIGKGKGLKTVLSLTITIVLVIYILLPLMLKGVNPIPISILISILATVVTIFLVAGINSKSISAIIGTSAGVIIAGLISYYVGIKANLTGLSAEEATMLMYIPQGIDFNFRNLLFSGIILGTLGATMDVGISIASSIEEIHNANKDLTKGQLFNSGMNVGKDVMGTMTNTLILAYTGSSIPLLLVFMAYETSLVKVFSLDIIATEIVRSLSGSIGLILTIPITAFIASNLIKYEMEKRRAKS